LKNVATLKPKEMNYIIRYPARIWNI